MLRINLSDIDMQSCVFRLSFLLPYCKIPTTIVCDDFARLAAYYRNLKALTEIKAYRLTTVTLTLKARITNNQDGKSSK